MKIKFLTVYFLFIFIENAHAYIDPGTGSLILQLILGGIAAAFAMINGLLYKIKTFLKKILKIKDKKNKINTIEVDKVIIAIGIIGNIDNLGLENIDIKTENGHIITDKWSNTNIKNIYAIGDVAGAPWLAHKASHEAVICVEKISGLENLHPLNKNNIPGCVYSTPQIASIGLTEKIASENYNIKVGKFPLMANGKAQAIGSTSGFVKVIYDEKTGELLGAHMIGDGVTELIHGYAIAKNMEGTEEDIKTTVFPHPTLSESLHEAVLNAYDISIHF